MSTYVVAPTNPKRWWNRFFTASQVGCVFAFFWLRWFRYAHLPHPGWAVALIAVAAAAMSIHEGMRDWQKIFWIIVIAVMLITELRAINKDHDDAANQASADRNAQDVKFAQVLQTQKEAFEKIANGLNTTIKTSQSGFSSVLSSSKEINKTAVKTLASANEAIDSITGGDTFIYLDFYPPSQYISFHKIGKHPIYEMSTFITSYSVRQPGMADVRRIPPIDFPATRHPYLGFPTFTVSMLEPSHRAFSLDPIFVNIEVVMTARNGTWLNPSY